MAVSARIRQFAEVCPGASAYDEESFGEVLELRYQGESLIDPPDRMLDY
jgi:hypothetical protein